MDHRYTGQHHRETYQDRFNEKSMTLTVVYDDCENEEISFSLPAVYEVCETCSGTGKHVNPSIDDCGLTAEDFAEDPDFEEDYRSGTYDVPCYECQGLRVVPRVDREKIEKEGSEEAKVALKKWNEFLEEEDAYRRERESERRYGA